MGVLHFSHFSCPNLVQGYSKKLIFYILFSIKQGGARLRHAKIINNQASIFYLYNYNTSFEIQ